MSHAIMGTIVYRGAVHEVWYSVDPGLAAESWEMTRARYYPDYQGPPPSGLERLLAQGRTRGPKRPPPIPPPVKPPPIEAPFAARNPIPPAKPPASRPRPRQGKAKAGNGRLPRLGRGRASVDQSPPP